MQENPTSRFLTRVSERRANGEALEEAVRKTASLNPGLMQEVLEIIGSWPSSDAALRYLREIA